MRARQEQNRILVIVIEGQKRRREKELMKVKCTEQSKERSGGKQGLNERFHSNLFERKHFKKR